MWAAMVIVCGLGISHGQLPICWWQSSRRMVCTARGYVIVQTPFTKYPRGPGERGDPPRRVRRPRPERSSIRCGAAVLMC